MKREKQDHAIFELVKHPSDKSGHGVKVTTPDAVMRCPNKDELEEQLKHYAHPFIKHVCPDSTFARKFYVEKVRPALRYYCKKFSVKVPEWLKDDKKYLDMDDDQKTDLFGTRELNVREFSKINAVPGGTSHPAEES
jgi:hypothetical protein